MRSRLCGQLASLLLLLSSVFLTGCAMPKGWHVASNDDEGGIIGTGIIGTVTGLGSIYVNGVRIAYDTNLKVQTAFSEESPEQLIPGDTVKVEANWKEGGYHAMSIERYRPIIAPIEAIADDRSWIEALGTRIRIDKTTQVYWKNDVADRRMLSVGAWIAVDGIWQGKDVIASNIRRIEPSALASVRGVVGKPDGRPLSVGGVRVDSARDIDVEPGSVIAVQGTIKEDEDGSYLTAEKVAVKQFSSAVRHVLVEGFVSTPSTDGAYTVYGTGLTAFVDDPEEPMDRRRSVFCGTLNGTYSIKKAVPIEAGSGSFEGQGDAEPNEESSGPGC